MSNIFSIIKHPVLPVPVLAGFAITGSLALLTAWKLMKRGKHTIEVPENAVVVITGCDSGLGYSIACHCREIGFYVFAGVLNLKSAGAEALETLRNDEGNISVIKLDITDSGDIKKSVGKLSQFLSNNPQYYLHGIINNAGVMIFGEFEWQTNEMIFQQLNVNLCSTIYFTKAFLPLLRTHKGRIVNVSSHCARAPLPGLSVYAASKAGLEAWNNAIRVEYAKYGIMVVSFLPGSFFLQSNILSKQSQYASEMKAAMTNESIEFYGDYFDRYHEYLAAIAGEKPLQRLPENKLYQNLTDALISKTPASSYHVSPLRYRIYHFLFLITPTTVRDYLVEKFVSMPAYKKMS